MMRTSRAREADMRVSADSVCRTMRNYHMLAEREGNATWRLVVGPNPGAEDENGVKIDER